MPNQPNLDPEILLPLDPQNMWQRIASMGEHVLDAELCAYRDLEGKNLFGAQIKNIVVAGMGGSAVGGELVATYLKDELKIPMVVNRSYSLPAWATANDGEPSSFVIAVSYSGGTEETLAQYMEAKERRIPVVCITTGGKLAELAVAAGDPVIYVPAGMQPRAALAYSLVPILVILYELELIESRTHAIKAAAKHLNYLATIYGPSAPEPGNLAVKLAADLYGKAAIVYSADVLGAVNYRWRGQMHENAKHIAFGNTLPELGHIEISGWSNPKVMIEEFSVVFLRSLEDENPNISRKIEVLKKLLGAKGMSIHEFHASGATKLDRLFSLIALADWTSYYLALLSAVDPTPIPAIEDFKNALKPKM